MASQAIGEIFPLTKFPLNNQLLPIHVYKLYLGIVCVKSYFAAVALCNDPVDIDNGVVTFTGNTVGDTANYTCDSGFELTGDANTTCTLVDVTSAEFQPAPPSCRREFAE